MVGESRGGGGQGVVGSRGKRVVGSTGGGGLGVVGVLGWVGVKGW